MHFVGASRKGKSNALEVLIRQDVLAGTDAPRGLTFIDPHGSTFASLVSWIADHQLHRYRGVRILDPGDPDFAFSFNPFRSTRDFETSALVDLLVNATTAVWGGQDITQTPRLRTVLSELYYALAVNDLTLLEANDFLRYEDPKGLRRHLVSRLPSEESRAFWDDLDRLPPSRRHEYLESTASRLRPFLRSPFIRRVFGQRERTIDLAEEMDRGSIILVNLKPGKFLSPEASRLLGTLLVTEYYTACFRRKNIGLQHFLYLDECQRFLSQDVARILDESRKFGLSLVLSHQHLGHLREAGELIFGSVMTNTHVKVIFGGLEPDDAEYMARTIFRGMFDLQRPKERLYGVQAVGNQKVHLAQESTTLSTSDTTGHSSSRGTTTSESTATTKSSSRTESASVSRTESSATATGESWSHSRAENWSESHGESTGFASIDSRSDLKSASDSVTATPGGIFVYGEVLAVSEASGSGIGHTAGSVTSSGSTGSSTTGGSDTETNGGSFTRTIGDATSETHGGATSTGTAVTEGRTTSESFETGSSTAHTTGHATSQGLGEAYIARYEKVPGPLWDLQDQVHVKSVAIANLPVGQAWVRVGNKRPQRLVLPYLGDTYVLPERIERVRRQILEATPYVTSAAQVEAEYGAYREKLIAAAAPEPVEEPTNWREGGE